MDKLSAKMEGFATVRYEAWAGIGQGQLQFSGEYSIRK